MQRIFRESERCSIYRMHSPYAFTVTGRVFPNRHNVDTKTVRKRSSHTNEDCP